MTRIDFVSCGRCERRLPVRFDTVDGELVEVVAPCGWCERKKAGICQRCKVRPVFAKKGWGLWCEPCYPVVRRAQQKRHRAEKQDPWKHRGICMDCKERPVDGKVGWAETCEPCRAERKRQSAKRSYQNDPAKREARNAYKREWRKRNRAKVKMQKRRDGIRRTERVREYQRRYRAEVEAGTRTPKRAPRNARGERTCLRCPTVLTGRAKLCGPCRAGLEQPQAMAA